jgi:hypothetical protein
MSVTSGWGQRVGFQLQNIQPLATISASRTTRHRMRSVLMGTLPLGHSLGFCQGFTVAPIKVQRYRDGPGPWFSQLSKARAGAAPQARTPLAPRCCGQSSSTDC